MVNSPQRRKGRIVDHQGQLRRRGANGQIDALRQLLHEGVVRRTADSVVAMELFASNGSLQLSKGCHTILLIDRAAAGYCRAIMMILRLTRLGVNRRRRLGEDHVVPIRCTVVDNDSCCCRCRRCRCDGTMAHRGCARPLRRRRRRPRRCDRSSRPHHGEKQNRTASGGAQPCCLFVKEDISAQTLDS